MNLFTKTIAWSLLGLQLISVAYAADSDTLQTKTHSPLSGVEVRQVQTVSGGELFQYQVVECDLSNPNLKLDLLYPAEGASTLKPSLGIGTDNGAAVVMNADYFNRSSEANKGSAVGYNEKDGQLISNALEEQVYSFSYNKNHEYSFDVYSNQIKIGFRGEVFEFVKTYNKYSSLEGVAIFDKHWGKESLGSHGTLVELVIEDNILTEIRRDLPPVEIPENGFVLAGLSDLTTLFEQVQVGDQVTLEIITTPTLEFLPDFTVGGGSLLVKEGKLMDKMSYPKSSTSFPALGISEDGKTAWFVTAVNQTGLTQKKMAELCLKEGAYYAFSLDGGGSTQCAVVDNTTGELQYIHDLAAGYERPVANAIGVIAQAEKPKAYGIHTENTIAYPNIPKKITYTVYDENGQPMQVNQNDVKLQIKSGSGSLNNGYFYGEAMSSSVVSITYGTVRAECEITTVSPAEYAQKTKSGYLVTNGDGFQREITDEEYGKSTNLMVKDKLSTVDSMAENRNLPYTLSLYGGSKSYQTFFQRLLTNNVLQKLTGSIYPFSENAVENELIEIVTIDNSKGKILKNGMSEWNRMEKALNTQKQNIILVMTDHFTFEKGNEEDLFFELLTKKRMEVKNILVVSRGEKTELTTLRDGVRAVSVEYEKSGIDTFLKNPTKYLKIHYNESQMTYEIASDNLFEKR